MPIDKVILPNNLQDVEPIDGLRDNEEMIIILTKKKHLVLLKAKLKAQ